MFNVDVERPGSGIIHFRQTYDRLGEARAAAASLANLLADIANLAHGKGHRSAARRLSQEDSWRARPNDAVYYAHDASPDEHHVKFGYGTTVYPGTNVYFVMVREA